MNLLAEFYGFRYQMELCRMTLDRDVSLEVLMMASVGVISMCLIGIVFNIRFLVAIQHEKRRTLMCHGFCVSSGDVEHTVSKQAKWAHTLARAA